MFELEMELPLTFLISPRGSLRTGLVKGEITFRWIHAAFSFNNYLVAVNMSWQLLLQTLEHGVLRVEQVEGGARRRAFSLGLGDSLHP